MRPLTLIGLTLALAACVSTPALNTPMPAATPSATPAPLLGAGFRYSTYGPAYDPGPEYWLSVGQRMAAKFPTARPQTIWIVGNYAGAGPLFTFPGKHDDFNIHFSPRDKNEAALTLFDQQGVAVWLQVEPGDVDVAELIHVMLNQYGHHPSVIGVGVDVEWFRSDDTPEGEPVSDALAAEWVAAARAHNPQYRLFLKHWETTHMPPTYRDGVVFVDDSQQFESFESLVAEFSAWGKWFAPASVGFQYGYPADKKWWGQLADPAGEIGQAVLAATPHTEALFWVDFTALEVFPPEKQLGSEHRQSA